MRKIFVLLLLFGLVACNEKKSEDKPQTVTIFAAASLTDAFEELGTSFESQNPNIQVELNFASSSTLATQIQEGAGADVFASANQNQMEAVSNLVKNEPQIFAQNIVVVAVRADSDIQSLEDLAQDGRLIVVAAPDVPIRVYTDQVLGLLELDSQFGSDYVTAVKNNIVSEETDVRAVVLKVSLGEADAGFVYSSDVTPDLAESVRLIEIPSQFNITAQYPIAAISDRPAAEMFIDFVLSNDGQAILSKWGFRAAEQG